MAFGGDLGLIVGAFDFASAIGAFATEETDFRLGDCSLLEYFHRMMLPVLRLLVESEIFGLVLVLGIVGLCNIYRWVCW